MKMFPIVLAFLFPLVLVSCSNGGDGSAPASTSTGITPPALTATDKNNVAPCPNQAIFQDTAELAALKDALTTGTLTFLDVPFNGGDADNFKKKCGLEGFWDPANNTNEVTTGIIGGPPVTLAKLLNLGNAGICTAGSTPMNFITGFPAAGTYRGEIKAAKGGSTWHLRMRGVASGSSAGNTFLAEGVTVPTDIENTLQYKVNGVVTPHADLLTAIVAAAATTNNPTVLDVSKTGGGATVFSVAIELICVTKS